MNSKQLAGAMTYQFTVNPKINGITYDPVNQLRLRAQIPPAVLRAWVASRECEPVRNPID